MAAANSEGNAQKPTLETFQLFSSSASGFGIFDDAAQQLPAIPPPPCVEVLASEVFFLHPSRFLDTPSFFTFCVPSSVKHNVDSVNLDGVTLLKGRVNTQQVFGLSNSDLVPGKYEVATLIPFGLGGLKLWEGSLDLIKALQSDIKNGLISFGGKRVLEVGCGHGLPGIFALLEGAAAVHFQDFNAEVLRCLTIPNLNANLSGESQPSSSNLTICDKAEIRFFAGDWSEIDKLLPHVSTDAKHNQGDGYDFILMAETVYSINSLQNLYNLIKKCSIQCLQHPDGVVYMAAKKYYFGVGGGSRRFLSVVEKDGVMTCSLVAEITDGSSNVREVWKLAYK
ncbi:Histidine protein methyltransferase 1-like protein [Mucuna pruriens]|uniref:protein-histidine N-methyltransferase n=1 Tax=Mucuna pruriens TaxID=157652 RepID=A0A371HVP4_MUCPR|nr:Histidine protein methyltransferase 1-like protein [Mucuna pruriens]